jgi:hypothetical protein
VKKIRDFSEELVSAVKATKMLMNLSGETEEEEEDDGVETRWLKIGKTMMNCKTD